MKGFGPWLARVLACATLIISVPANAHEGPPFPLFLDRPVENFMVSVWADPDIGTGTFFVILESEHPGALATLPRVDLWVQPTTARLPPVSYRARLENNAPIRFIAEPAFDRGEMWKVGIVLATQRDEHEILVEVEATPPGLGPWGMVIYAIPFVMVGGLWTLMFVKRRQLKRAQRADLNSDSTQRNRPEATDAEG